MIEQIVIWVLGILSALFGGLNIFQWLTLRSYKRLKAAEAEEKEISNFKSIIEANSAEIKRLEERLKNAEAREISQSKRYDELYDKYNGLRNEFEQYKLNHK